MAQLDLSGSERGDLWKQVVTQLEAYYADTKAVDVAPVLDQAEVRKYVRAVSFDTAHDTSEVVDKVITGLTQYAVHVSHPSYFGLFNPRPNFPSILADVITAGFNPQMAAWSHSPYAVECENYMIEEVGIKFGWDRKEADGTFCSGGAEANLTALLCALQATYPAFANEGVIGLKKRPIIYTSAESHHSIARAARIAGLGANSIRNVPVDPALSMKVAVLDEMIQEDIAKGHQPIMVTATAGATGPGAIDPLVALAAVCKREELWYHVDGAYGGAMILSDEYKMHLEGIENADSITFDIHKWTSVPMGASLLLTRHRDILSQTFRISADYMPKDAAEIPITDPFAHSIQWSRRFIGLKLYMTLGSFGWKGMKELVDHTCEMGDLARQQLESSNWKILNTTVMPIICFTYADLDDATCQQLCDTVNQSGKIWISTYPIHGQLTLRVCITNYNTSPVEINELIDLLNTSRQALSQL